MSLIQRDIENNRTSSSLFRIYDHDGGEQDKSTTRRGVSKHRILKVLTYQLHDLYKMINGSSYYYNGRSLLNKGFQREEARILSSKITPFYNCGQDNIEGNLIISKDDEISPEASTTFCVQPTFKSPVTTHSIAKSSQLPLPPSNLSHHERCYKVINMLGQGSFGQVVECVNVRNNTKAAIKIIKNIAVYNSQGLQELNILHTLQTHYNAGAHNIITVRDWFPYKNHLCLVFDKLNRSVLDVLHDSHYQGLRCVDISKVVRQLLQALSLLQTANVIHCDLKPENILFCDHPGRSSLIRLIDLGSATYVESTRRYFYIQSRFYRAPEVLLHGTYDTVIDMWSLGCVVAEMCIGVPLFAGTSEYHQILRIVQMLGMPPTYMLDKGARTSEYFKRLNHNHYVVKTPEEYANDHLTEVIHPKNYFRTLKPLQDTSLKYLILNSPINPKLKLTDELKAKEMAARPILYHFLKGVLEYDPRKRWTATIALQHPFITGEGIDQLPAFERRVLEHKNSGGAGGMNWPSPAAGWSKKKSTSTQSLLQVPSLQQVYQRKSPDLIRGGGNYIPRQQQQQRFVIPPATLPMVHGLGGRRCSDPLDRNNPQQQQQLFMMHQQQQQQLQQQQAAAPYYQSTTSRILGRVHRVSSTGNITAMPLQQQQQQQPFIPYRSGPMPPLQPQPPPSSQQQQQPSYYRFSPQMLVHSSSPMLPPPLTRSYVPPMEQRVDSRRFSLPESTCTLSSLEHHHRRSGTPSSDLSSESIDSGGHVFAFEQHDGQRSFAVSPQQLQYRYNAQHRQQPPQPQQLYLDSPIQRPPLLPKSPSSSWIPRQHHHIQQQQQQQQQQHVHFSPSTPINIRTIPPRDKFPFIHGRSAPSSNHYDFEAQQQQVQQQQILEPIPTQYQQYKKQDKKERRNSLV